MGEISQYFTTTVRPLRTVVVKYCEISPMHACFFFASASDVQSPSSLRRSGAMPPDTASSPWQRAQF